MNKIVPSILVTMSLSGSVFINNIKNVKADSNNAQATGANNGFQVNHINRKKLIHKAMGIKNLKERIKAKWKQANHLKKQFNQSTGNQKQLYQQKLQKIKQELNYYENRLATKYNIVENLQINNPLQSVDKQNSNKEKSKHQKKKRLIKSANVSSVQQNKIDNSIDKQAKIDKSTNASSKRTNTNVNKQNVKQDKSSKVTDANVVKKAKIDKLTNINVGKTSKSSQATDANVAKQIKSSKQTNDKIKSSKLANNINVDKINKSTNMDKVNINSSQNQLTKQAVKNKNSQILNSKISLNRVHLNSTSHKSFFSSLLSKNNNNNDDKINQQAVQLAKQLANQNIPYVWGGESQQGMDCSGLTDYIFQQVAGVSLGHYTVTQETKINPKSLRQIVPGDLLFWGEHGASYHVGIYIGNNQYISSPAPGQTVSIQNIDSSFMPSFAGSVKLK